MASTQAMVVVVFAVVAVAFAPPALAADIIVGGENGWGLGIDYDKWVDGNDFIVGDTLVFKYAMGKHTVVEATAENFAACSKDSSLGSWSSGEDRVPLGTAGPRWFFCGVGDHCAQQGMKLNITVLPIVRLSASGPSSSSSSPSSSPATRTPWRRDRGGARPPAWGSPPRCLCSRLLGTAHIDPRRLPRPRHE
ncbi:hypothetical protein EJB05_15063, partial [Eragrostis curvula]